MTRGNGKKPKDDPASLGTFAGLFQRNGDELAALRAKQRPVNLNEAPRRVEPLPAPAQPAKVISAEEAMRLAFEEATDARSRKFLSEGMKLGDLAVEGDRSRDRRRPGGGRRRRRLSRWGWNCARDALALLGLLGGGRHGSRLGTLLLLPLGPQEQEGKAENEEEDESLGIHGFHVL